MLARRRAQTIRLVSFLCGALSLAATLFGAIVQAQAQQPPSASDARIIVIGQGSVSAPPDYAAIGCGVTTKAKTAKEATDANSKLMTAVIAALHDAGIEQKDIQTARFSVQPVYAPPQPNAEPKLTGFSATNQFSVTVRQIGQTGDVLDRLIAAGATDIGQVEFQHADVSKVLDLARDAAMADARRKAEIYARAAGVSLGVVVWIAEDTGQRILFSPKSAMRATAAAPSVPIAAGEDTLSAEVTVGFDIAH